MARLIPHIDPREIKLKPERAVAEALVRDLPDSSRIYHSYCWLKPDRNHSQQPLREGEADFVILDPRFGILVLEVKGGPVAHVVANGKATYYRELPNGGTREIKDPFLQARTNLHRVAEILQIADSERWFTGTYGYAVAFPDCTVDRSAAGPLALPHDVAPAIVFFAEHLADMDRAVRGAFNSWSRRKHSSLSSEEVQCCQDRLQPVFRLVSAGWRHIDEDERRLVQLTEQQQMVLDGLRDNRRLAVRGGAGTGKTMLACWRAMTFATQGKSTLLLCFNSALADWLTKLADEELTANDRKNLSVATFHRLCRRFYGQAKLPFAPPSDAQQAQTFWDETVPDTMFDFVLDRVASPRFDAVIVDEGQDFAPNWWLVVESLQRDRDGMFYVFHDPHQNIFGKQTTMPKTDAVFQLTFNCRNTRQIHKYAMECLQAESLSANIVPEGETPKQITTNSPASQKKQCEELLAEWKRDYRLTSDRIVILSMRRRNKSCLGDSTRIAGFGVVDTIDEWRAGQGVLFSTISAFKGLEADAVIVLQDSSADTEASMEKYVAASRAKHLLAVIESTPE